MFTYIIMGITLVMTVGCGESEDPVPAIPEGTLGMLGEVKTPIETVAAAPQAPGVGRPSVTAVEYFKDWRRTKPITEAQVGDLVYVQVTFSEAMEVVVADDKTARPVIFHKIDKQLTRFRIVPLGSRGEDFVHGDIKPIKTATTFIGKHTVQEDTATLTIAVGKQSTDLQGTPLSAFYTHKERLQIRQPDTTPPTVIAVSYYADEALTDPLTDIAHPGDTIYTKIVFSEEMQTVVANGGGGRPVLYYRVGSKLTRLRIRPESEQLTSGSAKPIGDGSSYLGAHIVTEGDLNRPFTVVVGKNSVDLHGNRLGQTYAHPESLRVVQRPSEPEMSAADPDAPVAVVYGAPREPFSRENLQMVVGGEGITRYKHIFSFDDNCTDAVHQRNSSSFLYPIRIDYPGLSGKHILTLCVVGMNADGVWQETPTTHRLVYDPAAIDILPRTTYTFTTEDRNSYPRIFEGYINLELMERREQRRLTVQDYVEEFGVAFPDVGIYHKTAFRAYNLAKSFIPDYGQQFEHTSWISVELLRLWVASFQLFLRVVLMRSLPSLRSGWSRGSCSRSKVSSTGIPLLYLFKPKRLVVIRRAVFQCSGTAILHTISRCIGMSCLFHATITIGM